MPKKQTPTSSELASQSRQKNRPNTHKNTPKSAPTSDSLPAAKASSHAVAPLIADEKTRIKETRLIATWLFQKPENTKLSYESDLRVFFDLFPNVSLLDIGPEHVGLYLASLAGQRNSSKKRRKACISSLFKFLVKSHYIEKNPVESLDIIKVADQTQFRILSHSEIKRMVEMESNTRNKILLKLLYKSGLRVSELCSLKFANFKERDGRFMMIVVGKGNKTRTVELDEPTYDEIKTLQNYALGGEQIELPNTAPVFRRKNSIDLHLSRVSVWKILKQAALRAGANPEASPHWTRHSHATRALELGEDLRVIQETLGHESINTTTKYTRVAPGRSSSSKIDI